MDKCIDEEDRRAIVNLVAEINESRVQQGLSPLPSSTAAERNQSYQTILASIIQQRHIENISAAGEKLLLKDLAPRVRISSDAQRTAALNALAPLP